jgi:spermidine synthase
VKIWLFLLISFLSNTALAQESTLWSRETDWGKVLVRQAGDLRTLVFSSESGETEESRMSVSEPSNPSLFYVRQMLAALALWESNQAVPPDAPRFLVVGLGGASLSVALADRFPDSEVVSVEIEPVVVEAARKYFFYEESGLVQTVVDDARHYLEENSEPFDVIFLDAFDGTGVPPTLRTVEFVELLDRNMNQDGAVIANIHFTPRQPSLRYQKSLRAVFRHGYICTGLAQGIGLFTNESTSAQKLKSDLELWEKKYRVPLETLLTGRHQESLDGVEPFRDE